MSTPCAVAITRRLAEHGGWLGRGELVAGLGWHEAVVDDELAELVMAGTLLFNPRGREYRLGGTLWARRAMRELVRTGVRRAAVMGPAAGGGQAHVGLAQRTTAPDGTERLVMAELEAPCGDLPGALRLAALVDAWAR